MVDYKSLLNLRPYSAPELQTLAADFKAQVAAGIAGQTSSLSMLVSGLVQQPIPEFENTTVMAVDIGGSKLRLGLFELDHGQAKLLSEVVAFEIETQITNLDEYLELIAHKIKLFCEQYIQPEVYHGVALGVAFSFPARTVKSGANIDADRTGMSDGWGKGMIVHSSAVNISQQLREHLHKQGITCTRSVFVNDVVALLLAANSPVSLVVGTGFNIGLASADGNLYNTQATYFNNSFITETLSRPAKLYLKNLTQKLSKQGQVVPENDARLNSYAEIQISAGYLHLLLANSLAIAGEENLALLKAVNKIGTKALTDISRSDFAELESHTYISLADSKKNRLTEITRLLLTRSTDLVAAMLAGAFMSAEASTATAVAEGAVLHNVPGYKEEVEEKCSAILGQEVRVNLLEHGTLQGAAMSVTH